MLGPVSGPPTLSTKVLTMNIKNLDNHYSFAMYAGHSVCVESTPLNYLAVADAVWARMPVDGRNTTLA